jgi:hypothetical protein
VANQFAAMPSVHFGWALLVGLGVILLTRGRWRWLALLHPAVTLLVITATANHYWLDSVVAAVLVVASLAAPVLLAGRAAASEADRLAPVSG